MFVLLTGAFGNVGESTLIALLERECQVRCFDLKSKTTEKRQKQLRKHGDFETVWGDITDSAAVRSAVDGVDCIVHLAGIIPPMSERNPDLTFRVNVNGTENVIAAAESIDGSAKLIFASSVSLFGPTMHLEPPRKSTDPINPTDTYTRSKAKCEEAVRASNLTWTILRFAAVPPLDVSGDTSVMFDMPLDQRIEFVHSRDVGLACANAVTADTEGMTLLIGGGKTGQMLQREFISRLLGAMGLGMPPDEAFRQPKSPEEYFYTDWLDTTESQKILQYQTRTFDDFIEEYKELIGFKRHLAKLFSGGALKQITASSPYLRHK